jgi:hypothetical protein
MFRLAFVLLMATVLAGAVFAVVVQADAARGEGVSPV